MADFQPPPTYADVILVDEKTNRATFNPVWLKWFIDLVADVGPSGAGSVSSVALSLPTAVFDVSGSPVTTTGTLTATFDTQSANRAFMGPTTGAAATPTFRALVTADMPAGTGTVTSVTVSGDGTFLLSSGSPITTSGTITLVVGPDLFAFAGAMG